VSEDDKSRLIAWNRELTAAHQRLRQALRVTRDAAGGTVAGPARLRRRMSSGAATVRA
jgi:hypothetical protein